MSNSKSLGGALLGMVPNPMEGAGGTAGATLLRAALNIAEPPAAPSKKPDPEPTPKTLLEDKSVLEDLIASGPSNPRQRAYLEEQLAAVKAKIQLFEAGRRAGRGESK